MNILIVTAVSVREGEFVYPGEIQVIDYKEHVKEVCRLDSLLECAQGDLNQAMKISAYDEAKERELFEVSACHRILSDDPDCDITVNEIFESRRGDEYQSSMWSFAWWSWQACAKSRAGIQS